MLKRVLIAMAILALAVIVLAPSPPAASGSVAYFESVGPTHLPNGVLDSKEVVADLAPRVPLDGGNGYLIFCSNDTGGRTARSAKTLRQHVLRL